MAQNATSAAQGCIFCAVMARQAEASVVYEDETVVAFMDLKTHNKKTRSSAPATHCKPCRMRCLNRNSSYRNIG